MALAFLLALLLPVPSEPLVLRGVTVVDVRTGERAPHRTVVVQGERIAAVVPDAEADVPVGATVVDAEGQFLIPGLWDMHVHATTSPRFPALFVANGVTGVRDMFTQERDVKAVESRYLGGDALGPRIVAAGRILDGENPYWPGSLEAKTPEEGRAAVAELAADGASFVKVYSKLAPDTYRAIADEAEKRGLPFAGHVPAAVRAREAAELGQHSIEHLTGVLIGCSSAEDELLGKLPGQAPRGRALETFDEGRAAALFATFAEHGTWHCPTLVVLRSIGRLDDPEFTADDRVRFLPPFWKSVWDPKRDKRFASYTDEDWAAMRATFEKSLELVGAMHAAGVPLLAGTDCANPYCFPGFSLHDELSLLTAAGLTPLEALRTATWNPAVYLGREDELGSVEPGKLADLLLLAHDPLETIAHTRSIVGVVANGRWIDATRRAELLGE